MYELPTMNGVEEVVITAEVVDGRAQPLLIYAEKKGGAASAWAGRPTSSPSTRDAGRGVGPLRSARASAGREDLVAGRAHLG